MIMMNERERGGDLLTANDREKAVVGEGGNPRLTTSCIQKGERTFMPSGNTRLLDVFQTVYQTRQ